MCIEAGHTGCHDHRGGCNLSISLNDLSIAGSIRDLGQREKYQGRMRKQKESEKQT